MSEGAWVESVIVWTVRVAMAFLMIPVSPALRRGGLRRVDRRRGRQDGRRPTRIGPRPRLTPPPP